MKRGKKRMTAKERVLARYPKAKCFKHHIWRRFIVVNLPTLGQWHDSTAAAWDDAARRLP